MSVVYRGSECLDCVVFAPFDVQFLDYVHGKIHSRCSAGPLLDDIRWVVRLHTLAGWLRLEKTPQVDPPVGVEFISSNRNVAMPPIDSYTQIDVVGYY